MWTWKEKALWRTIAYIFLKDIRGLFITLVGRSWQTNLEQKSTLHLLAPWRHRTTYKVLKDPDYSFANNTDLFCQLGHIVFLCHKINAAIPIIFKSNNCRHITRLVIPSEVMALADIFDVAIPLFQDTKNIICRHISVKLLTDSKILFEVIYKCSPKFGKCDMLDLEAAREAQYESLITGIGFVRSNRNPSDGVMKPMSHANIWHAITCRRLVLDIF